MINKNRIKNKRKKNITNQSEKFRSLAPVTSEIKFNRYRNMFKTAFSKKYIANIAVTGPYSSGKSSIMQACKKKYGEDEFITLSLTNFTQENNNDTINIENNNKEEKEENLESQLINQLLHKIKPKRIKESRFVENLKINTKSFSYIFSNALNTIFVSIFLLCAFILLLNDNIINNFALNKIIDIKQLCINIIITASAVYIPYLTYNIISKMKQKKILRKINIYGNDIELFPNDDTSIFDKHTDEILYLFENAGVKYFIFEDIDRYEDVTVFKKLREINILLNDKRKREKKPLIKFIYLICDNMFTAEERTKFFDFIIPVVPFIHKGNSYDYMINKLFPEESKNEKNKKFLIKISLFIDNARILKNIANEYYIYNKFIHLKDRKPYTKFIKLLSLIIYKNLFPKDFNLLYFNKGYLAELFNKEAFALKQEKSVEEYKNKTIKECINVNNTDIFFKAPDGYDYIYNSGYMNLIKFLITDGYVDETYNDYLSKITENSLTYEERAFLQNIMAHHGEQYLYHLSRIMEKEYLDNLLLFIDEIYYNRIEILNIYLLDSIVYQYFETLDNKYKYIYETIYQLILNNMNYKFINYYYQYVTRLYKSNNININDNDVYNSFTNMIINNYQKLKPTSINNINLHYFICIILNIVSTYKVYFINPNNKLKKELEEIKEDINNNSAYLSALEHNMDNSVLFYYHNFQNNIIFYDISSTEQNDAFILSEENLDTEKFSNNDILNLFKEIGIKFTNLNNVTSNEILNQLIDMQLFDVNFINIAYIIRNNNQNIDFNYIENILEELLILSDKKLQIYILDNFEQFIKTSYMYYKDKKYIEKDVYDKILENELIADKHKEIFKIYYQSLEQ